jgi:fumarylacetoacetase
MHVTWPVEVGPESPFPITNIPFGIFSTQDSVRFLYEGQCLKYSILTVWQPGLRVGIAIGQYILDLSCLEAEGMFQDLLQHKTVSNRWNRDHSGTKKSIFAQASLNSFAALSKATRSAIRNKIIDILQYEDSTLFSDPAFNNEAFHEQCKAQMHLPMQIGDFTDFLCSRTHADNVSLLLPMCIIHADG